MVNQTSLQKIIQFIRTNNLKQMKKWSDRFRNDDTSYDRKGWYLYKLIKQIRMILVLLSGDDVIALLKDLKYYRFRALFNLIYRLCVFRSSK